MKLPLMNPDRIHWVLIGVLVVVPVLATACLQWCYRKRGGTDKGWGGALFATLCWIVALVLIWRQVAD